MNKNKLFGSHASRYITVGLTVYIFELIVIYLAQKFGAGDLLAVGLSFWLGLIASFGLQKFITFQDKRKQRSVVLVQFLAVSLLVLWNFGFTLLITNILKGHISTFLCRTLALGITTLWNFYLYKTRIFKIPDIDLID